MFECPGCGANLKFDIAKQAMHCEYCDTVLDPTEAREVYTAKEQTVTLEEGEMPVAVYTCSQCGAELIGDENEAMVFCSFCGSSVPLNQRMTNMKRPERIVPFMKTKADCISNYKSFMRKALYAPSYVKEEEYVESFRGIYMPYWNYDMNKNGPITYRGEHKYQKGDYEYTDHYVVNTSVDYDYKGINYDASSTFADNLSGGIAPFSSGQSKDFSAAYMSGFYADVYDVNQETYKGGAKLGVKQHAARKVAGMQRSRKYSVCMDSLEKALEPDSVNAHLYMMPVWFLCHRIKDKKGTERVNYAVVNGQTGKVAADVPIDMKKFVIGSLIIAIPLFLVLNLILTMIPLYISIAAEVINILMLISLFVENNSLKRWESGEDDAGHLFASGKKSTRKQKGKKKDKSDVWKKNKLYFFVSLVVSLYVFLFRPVSDAPYYVAVVVSGLCDIMMMFHVISLYNRMTSRPLPQFKRKGGDDQNDVTQNEQA